MSDGGINFYDVELDDDRFLMARQHGSKDGASTIILVQNFFEELNRLVPTDK